MESCYLNWLIPQYVLDLVGECSGPIFQTLSFPIPDLVNFSIRHLSLWSSFWGQLHCHRAIIASAFRIQVGWLTCGAFRSPCPLCGRGTRSQVSVPIP